MPPAGGVGGNGPWVTRIVPDDDFPSTNGSGVLTIVEEFLMHRRCLKHLKFDNYYVAPGLDEYIPGQIGITASSFDPEGSPTGDVWVRGITANTAKLSRIRWAFNTSTELVPSISLIFSNVGDSLATPPTENTSATALVLNGTNGDYSFEGFTIKNTATDPSGSVYLMHSSYDGTPKTLPPINGTVTMEFVL